MSLLKAPSTPLQEWQHLFDLVINNATTAHGGPGPLMLPDMDEFTQVIRVNAVAPVYVAECFVEHVAASEMKMTIFIGTRSGSISDNGSGGTTPIAAATPH